MMKKDMEIKNIYYVMTLLIVAMIMMVSISLVDIGIFIFRDTQGQEVFDPSELTIPGAEAFDRWQYVLVEEGMDGATYEKIREQLTQENLPLIEAKSLAKESSMWEVADVLIVTGEAVVDTKALEAVKALLEDGGQLVVIGLGNTTQEAAFNQLIGAYTLGEDAITQRLRTLEDFFLGGVFEFEVEAYPYALVELKPSAKQLLDDGKGNPIVWRNTYKGSKVYVINGQIMASKSGYGIFTGIQTDLYPDYLYPVVNGMAHTYVGLPYLLNENTSMMVENYQRDSLSLQEDIIIPDIIGITQSRDVIPSAFLSAGFREQDVDQAKRQGERVKNYGRDFQKFGGYIGLASFGHLETEQALYHQVSGQEELSALYVDEIDKDMDGWLANEQKMHILLKPWSLGGIMPIFNKEGMTEVPITYETMGASRFDAMNFYSIATTYGLIVHNLDMEKILYPDEAKDHWMGRSKEYAEFMDTYLDVFADMPAMNIQNLAERIRIYQEAKPWIKYGENQVEVYVENWQGEMHFILRSDKEIVQVVGGNATPIDAHSYLIDVYEPYATIDLVKQ